MVATGFYFFFFLCCVCVRMFVLLVSASNLATVHFWFLFCLLCYVGISTAFTLHPVSLRPHVHVCLLFYL